MIQKGIREKRKVHVAYLLLSSLGGLAVIYLPRLIAGLVAMLLAVYLLRRSRQVAEAVIRAGAPHRDRLDYDRRPSRSQRRLLRAHLKLALKLDRTCELAAGHRGAR